MKPVERDAAEDVAPGLTADFQWSFHYSKAALSSEQGETENACGNWKGMAAKDSFISKHDGTINVSWPFGLDRGSKDWMCQQSCFDLLSLVLGHRKGYVVPVSYVTGTKQAINEMVYGLQTEAKVGFMFLTCTFIHINYQLQCFTPYSQK